MKGQVSRRELFGISQTRVFRADDLPVTQRKHQTLRCWSQLQKTETGVQSQQELQNDQDHSNIWHRNMADECAAHKVK